ncbi:MAG: hypothetical protein JW722_07155 [Demequinaceae bacterium]|nr:hypothetical protein [Demequinaceae bacterium]
MTTPPQGPDLPPTSPQPVTPRTPATPSPTPGPAGPPNRVSTGATRVLPSSNPPAATPRPGVPAAGGPSPVSPGLFTPPSSSPPPDDEETDGDESRPFFRLPGVLIGLGILATALLGSLVYYLFFRPDPVMLAPKVVVIPLPTPTFEVFVPTEPTDFVAGLPLSTMTYGLTTLEEMPSSAHAEWPERFAEGWTLTYEDGSGSMVTVAAYQHYHEEDAIAAFEELWNRAETEAQAAQPQPTPEPSPSASPTWLVERLPIIAGDTQVGESFKTIAMITTVSEGGEGVDPVEVTEEIAAIVWRNTTAVFIMTADPSVIDLLFLEYGV